MLAEAANERCAHHAGTDADTNPASATDHTVCHCHHDADDLAGFDNFVESDDEGAKHLYSILPIAIDKSIKSDRCKLFVVLELFHCKMCSQALVAAPPQPPPTPHRAPPP